MGISLAASVLARPNYRTPGEQFPSQQEQVQHEATPGESTPKTVTTSQLPHAGVFVASDVSVSDVNMRYAHSPFLLKCLVDSTFCATGCLLISGQYIAE
jgi:hypothetical protein